MNSEDLAILIPDIDLLISKYEAGAKKALAKSSIERIENIATSLHISPLMQAEFTLNMIDSASMTQSEIFTLHSEQVSEETLDQKQENTTKKTMNSFFDIDCDTVDPNDDLLELGKKEYGKGWNGIRKGVGYKITNPVKISVESNPFKDLNEYWVKDLKSPKTFEDCFNCDVSFKLKSTFPGIEFAWEFDKILKAIDDFMKMFWKNLDPTAIYNQLCKFKLFVQNNFMCPANMQNLALMLPALFMKYSIDLGKLGFDLNWLLGGVIKAIFTAIITFLENIRAIVMPFINCYINAVNTTFGYIKSIVKALSKSIDMLSDAVQKVASSIHKAAFALIDLFHETETEKKQAKIDKKKAQLLEAQKKAAKLKAELLNEKHAQEKYKSQLAALNRSIKRATDFFAGEAAIRWIIINEDSFKTNEDDWLLKRSEFSTALKAYLSKNFSTGGDTLDDQIENLQELLGEYKKDKIQYKSKLSQNEDTIANDITAVTAEKNRKLAYETEIEALHKEAEKYRKKSFYEEYSGRKKTAGWFNEESGSNLFKKPPPNPIYKTGSIFTPASTKLNTNITNIAKDTKDWVNDRFGLKIENQYVNHEYWSYRKSSLGTFLDKTAVEALEAVRELLVSPAENLKAFINDFIGNVINAVRSLSLLFKQGAMLELKILGELLQLVHLVRLIRVIMKLIDEGISGCQNLDKNKTAQEALKESIQLSNKNLKVEIIDTEDNDDLQSAKIYATNTDHAYLLHFDDCSELSKVMEKQNPNLDMIYNDLKAALI
jgi:hypothetical protein